MHDQKKTRRLVALAVALLALSIAGVAVMTLLHHEKISGEAQKLAKSESQGRRVDVTEVKRSASEKELLLIGETRPFFSVTLLARVSGYMTGLYADIGDNVKKGQLLAEVQSPEAEQAYNSALADDFNKRRIAEREKILRRRKLVSQQEADQAVSVADIADATLKTQGVLRSYQQVVAPFDGRITQRFLDPGALIQNASGSYQASEPLFTISQIDKLRVFVYVDQKDASYVRLGDPVEISLPTHPDEKFSANVAQIAGELDPKTRTLLVEIHRDNQDQKIIAGSFVQVTMKIQIPSLLELPIQALVMRGQEPLVPVVRDNGTVHYTKIDLVDNDGENIRISGGVQEGEKVALNVGNSLQEGQKIRPISQPRQAAGQVRGH